MFSPGRDISLRRMILLATDAIALAVSIFSATMWRLGPQQGIIYVRENFYSLAASGLVFLVVFYGSGMYERASLVRRSLSFRLPLIATLISLAIITALFYAKSNIYVGRGILLIASGAVFLLTWFTRYLYSIAAGVGLLSKRALLVGEGRDAERALKLIKETADSGIKLVGVVGSKKLPAGSFM